MNKRDNNLNIDPAWIDPFGKNSTTGHTQHSQESECGEPMGPRSTCAYPKGSCPRHSTYTEGLAAGRLAERTGLLAQLKDCSNMDEVLSLFVRLVKKNHESVIAPTIE